MPVPIDNDYYEIGGMNVDVNPFQQSSSECNLILNWYSHKAKAKKVRFGYAQFLDNPDNSPVRNLEFYSFAGSTGLLRVSNKHTYLTTTQTGSWGSALTGMDWTVDTKQGAAQISGTSGNFEMLNNSTDGIRSWNGTTATSWNGSFDPKSTYLQTYQSRLFGDVNLLSLSGSWVGFDNVGAGSTTIAAGSNGAVLPQSTINVASTSGFLGAGSIFVTISGVKTAINYTGITTTSFTGCTGGSGTLSTGQITIGDPFSYDPNSANPAQGGLNPVDSGNNGGITGLSMVQNCLLIYKQRAIYRYDGINFLALNFANSVIPFTVAVSDYFRTNYFWSFNSCYQCDAQTVAPATFGVNTIIQDSFLHNTIVNPLTYCFDYLTFFWAGGLYYNGETIPNAMIVRDERFNELYIWSIGHTITAFGSYTDSYNARHLVTGDNLGNTYVWGEQYYNDAGTPINYILDTKYVDHQKPASKKVPQPQLTVSADPSNEAKVYVAKNFSNEYTQIGTTAGLFSKFNNKGATFPYYYNLSVRIAGSTKNGSRPEFYGWSLNFDEEEAFSDTRTDRQSKK